MDGSPHVARIPLRWADLDAQGHVNNALVVDYLQEARGSLMRSGDGDALLGTGIVVAQNRVEYLSPVEFSTRDVEVQVGVSALGASRIEMAYEVRQDGRACARATSTLCPFDFATQRPRRLSPDERRIFESVRVSAPDLRPLDVAHLHGRGHEHPFMVRWSDMDSYGHVNNVRYFDYVQEARIAMTTQADPSTTRDGSAMLWFVARQDIDYLAQMGTPGTRFVAHTAPVRLGTTSATFACEITDPRREHLVVARARTVLVCADLDGRPRPLPEATREILTSRLVG